MMANSSQCLANGVLITRLKTRPYANAMAAKDGDWALQPALKVCVTSALSKKDIEKAGITIRHAITKIMTRKSTNKAI
jgi:serine palmitoyltransferase